MALPQKAVEQLAREPARTPGGLSRLLMFAGTIFLVTLFIYLGMLFGYRPYLDRQVQELQGQIETFRQQIPVSDQERLLNFSSQIENLRKIFKEYRSAELILDWLEGATHRNVFYSDFDFDATDARLRLAGQGESAEDVGEQLAVFRDRSEIRELEFGGMSVDSRGSWKFSVTLFFNPTFFNVPNETRN